VSVVYDPVRYKQDSMESWTKRAHDYHTGWAGAGRGPFRSTTELVRAALIENGHTVLDLACGTGAVSAEAARYIGASGKLVGLDFARGALKIAKSHVQSGNFVEMDAEHIGLRGGGFNRVLCQYALMFFPDPKQVLISLKSLLKDDGLIAVAVHGTAAGVPYFSTIMEPVLKHAPEIRPEGTPTAVRFGNPEDLKGVLASAGFGNIHIRKFTFDYEAGTFEQYWQDYMSTTASAVRSKIESLVDLAEIKEKARKRAEQFITMQDGRIDFPWDVLIATATA
jgi:ubiquinone/menaquinone biosynthesis C-methylase UbiE